MGPLATQQRTETWDLADFADFDAPYTTTTTGIAAQSNNGMPALSAGVPRYAPSSAAMPADVHHNYNHVNVSAWQPSMDRLDDFDPLDECMDMHHQMNSNQNYNANSHGQDVWTHFADGDAFFEDTFDRPVESQSWQHGHDGSEAAGILFEDSFFSAAASAPPTSDRHTWPLEDVHPDPEDMSPMAYHHHQHTVQRTISPSPYAQPHPSYYAQQHQHHMLQTPVSAPHTLKSEPTTHHVSPITPMPLSSITKTTSIKPQQTSRATNKAFMKNIKVNPLTMPVLPSTYMTAKTDLTVKPYTTPKNISTIVKTEKKSCNTATPRNQVTKALQVVPLKKGTKRVRRKISAVQDSSKPRGSWDIEQVLHILRQTLACPGQSDSAMACDSASELTVGQGLDLNPREFRDIVHALGACIHDNGGSDRRVQLNLAPVFTPIYKPISKPLLRVGQDKTYIMSCDIPLKDRRRYDVFSDLRFGNETAFWCDQGNAHSVLDVSKCVQTVGTDGRHVNPRTIQVAHALASRVSRLLDTEVCVMKCFYYALSTRGSSKKRRKSETSSDAQEKNIPSRPLGLHKHIYMLCEQSIENRHNCLPGSQVWLVRYFVKGQLDPALAPLVDVTPGPLAHPFKRSESSDMTLPICD